MASSEGLEISSIPFEQFIGAPLRAAVKCQSMAALASLEFIKKTCFIPDSMLPPGSMEGIGPGGAGGEGQGTKYKAMELEIEVEHPGDETSPPKKKKLFVPFITLLAIPNFSIKSMTIAFNAKIDSMSQQSVSASMGMSMGMSVGITVLSLAGGSVGMSVGNQSSSSSGSSVKRAFSMSCQVTAVGGHLPCGLERLHEIVCNSIYEGNKPPEDQQSELNLMN